MGHSVEVHDFYCIQCGNKGLPVLRPCNKLKLPFHRKKLYCVHCRTIMNHIECRYKKEVEDFKVDFEAGLFTEEVEECKKFLAEEGEAL